MTNKEKFKNEMHDYANINEYYSYYGDVIYISSSYYKNEDYFIVIRTPKNIAIVTISADLLNEFLVIKNRHEVIADLNTLEPTLHWIVPTGFHNHINALLTDPEFPDKKELIKLKNNDIISWNRIFIENSIKEFKLDHTLLTKGIEFSNANRGGYTSTFTTVQNIYGTMFSLLFEWVTGNAFFDIKIKFFSQIKTRRLQYFDINELAELLKTMVRKDDQKTLTAIEAFIS